MNNFEYAQRLLYKIHDALTAGNPNGEEYLNLYIDLMDSLNELNLCLDGYNYNKLMFKELKNNKKELFNIFIFQAFVSLITGGFGIIYLPFTLAKWKKLVSKMDEAASEPLHDYQAIIKMANLKQELLTRKIIKFINENSTYLNLDPEDENIRNLVFESIWDILNFINEKEISYSDPYEQEIMIAFLQIILKNNSTDISVLLNLFANSTELEDYSLARTL